MMKKLIFSLIPLFGLSQGKLTLDNDLTGIYSTSNVSKLNLNFIGNNSIDIKKIEIGLSTNYALTFSPKISQNEFAQKINVGISDSIGWHGFISYQYNHSLLRKLQSDNWLGAGAGYKLYIGKARVSLSYALLYQNKISFDNSSKEIMRHSIRVKIKYQAKKFSFLTEYFYQPSFKFDGDYIVYGLTKITLLSKKHVSFVIQDLFNYSSKSEVKLIHNLTMGIGYNLVYNIKKKTV